MKRNKVTTNDVRRSDDGSTLCGIVENSAHIPWNGNDWAFGCDFWENDLGNAKTRSRECNHKCASTEGMNEFPINREN